MLCIITTIFGGINMNKHPSTGCLRVPKALTHCHMKVFAGNILYKHG